MKWFLEALCVIKSVTWVETLVISCDVRHVNFRLIFWGFRSVGTEVWVDRRVHKKINFVIAFSLIWRQLRHQRMSHIQWRRSNFKFLFCRLHSELGKIRSILRIFCMKQNILKKVSSKIFVFTENKFWSGNQFAISFALKRFKYKTFDAKYRCTSIF